jgi:F0F1-type ATP synthase membrane subunit a
LKELPHGFYLTNDINTTACLAILTSYFSAGFKIKGIGCTSVIKPTALLLPINIVEDFIKPLSLNFRLLEIF